MSFWSFFNYFFRRKRVDNAPTASLSPTKPGKALIIGVNAYPDAPLSGCANDARNYKSLLLSRYGFDDRSILMLLNEGAKTDSIKEGLKWLCKDVQAGQSVLFAYSGHGAQIPTDDPGETDGLSEVICPQDFDWSPERMLTDKQFVEIFKSMPVGVRFNWLSDSCHSGGGNRAISRPKNKPRLMPHTASMIAEIRKRVAANRRVRGVRAMLGGQLDVGYVSGCKSNQTSADTEINGVPCGAFTHYFLESLKTFPDDAPLLKVVLDAQRRLAVQGYSQEPQPDGPQISAPFMR